MVFTCVKLNFLNIFVNVNHKLFQTEGVVTTYTLNATNCRMPCKIINLVAIMSLLYIDSASSYANDDMLNAIYIRHGAVALQNVM